MESRWRFLKTLEIRTSTGPCHPLLGVYLKKSNTPIQKDVCAPVFTAELPTTAKVWKPPKYPSWPRDLQGLVCWGSAFCADVVSQQS